jgi:hypothetical protein
MPNRNAYAGRNIETLFKNSIVDHPKILKAIKAYYKLEGRFVTAIPSGIHGEKSDIKLSFACGHYIDANVKAYKAAFNQLTRTSAKKFSEKFRLNKQDGKELEDLIVKKSKNTKLWLFQSSSTDKWQSFFKDNAKAIVKWRFSFKPSREIIVLYDRNTSIFRIYPMAECLSKLDYTVTHTKGGFNIGQCVSFQRKGGNGSMSNHIPKTDIKHPGNNIQIKLKINKFVELMESVELGRYTV